jgi:hypothetical protein
MQMNNEHLEKDSNKIKVKTCGTCVYWVRKEQGNDNGYCVKSALLSLFYEVGCDRHEPVIKRIETDPDGLDTKEPGAKLDANKPMAGLLGQFGLALLEVAKVSTFGAQKYSIGGWQKVENGAQRYDNALMRHWLKEYTEPLDLDSNLLHAAHVAWNALAKLELIIRKNNKGV